MSPKPSKPGGLRALAAALLDGYETEPGSGAHALSAAQRGLEPRDRRLLQQLVQGTLRWRARIDDVLATAADRPFRKIEPRVRSPLRLAAYQLLFLDRVPGYAAVSEAVDEVRRRAPRAASFSNAVLRRISREPALEHWQVRRSDRVGRLAVETSHPEFLVRRWLDRFGEATTRDLLDANNRSAALQLLAFADRGGASVLAGRLAKEGVETRPLELAPCGLEVVSGDPFGTDSFREGLFYVQDQASQVAALIPAPRPGERFLDVAAAPGGKSFAAQALEPEIKALAADISMGRVGLLRTNRDRLGRVLPLVCADAGRPALRTGFDRVVVDLPCAGTGIFARNPDLKWRVSEAEIERLAGEGLRLLAGASSQVAPGGLLVALTCSIELEENEGVVDRFLAGWADFARVELGELLGPPLDRAVVGKGLWRLLPSPAHDGFTVQVLARRG